MKAYKVLNDRSPCHGGNGRYPRRKWLPKIDNPVLCQRGYHACKDTGDVFKWLRNGNQIWECELRGEIIEGDDKVVGEQIRITRLAMSEKDIRFFALDCAAHVLHIYEKQYPEDNRPRMAIDAARLFLNRKITRKEYDMALEAADAARDAARDAAWDAAWGAAGDAAWGAAWGAARDAARGAAWGAAGGAARGAEEKWQLARLAEYLEGRASD